MDWKSQLEIFSTVGNMLLYYLCYLGLVKFIERVVDKYERFKKSSKFLQGKEVSKDTK